MQKQPILYQIIFCVTTTLNLQPPCATKQFVTYYNYQKANWPGLREALHATQLMDAISGTNKVDVAWAVWKEKLRELIIRYIPLSTVTIRPKNKPWMTSHLHHLSRAKHRLFKLAKRSKQPSDWLNYVRYRNFSNNEFKKAKRQYMSFIQSRIAEEPSGCRKWWQKVKTLTRLTSSNPPVPDLEDNDTIASSVHEKAELLARFFALQCSGPDGSSDSAPGAPYPLPSSDSKPNFELSPISEETVLKHLLNLSPAKSTGCSLLTNRVLRETAPFISCSLTYIYNLSLRSSVFPEDWKSAVVVPVFKQRGSPQNPSNYRPVSLLPAVGKILDNILSKALSSYLVKNCLVSDHQFGFLPGRSATHQLVYIIDKWINAFESGQVSAAVFLDFQKAFDKVWHKGLLFKLATCGVTAEALEWFQSYLSDRTIAVRIEGVLSSPHVITAGVPQGSHLGPILFAVFINDLFVESNSELYADDVLLHNSFHKSNVQHGLLDLQQSVSTASTWASSWHGRFSPLKTELLPLGDAAVEACQSLPLIIEETPIKVVSQHKHLGVTLSSDLRWRAHIEEVLAKGKKRAGFLRHICREVNTDISCKIYLSFVRPVLEYACPVWHSDINAEQSLALERVQASVARSILKADWRTPKSALLQRLGWPALRWRRTIISMVFFHRLLRTAGPLSECVRVFPFSSSVSGRAKRKPLQLLLQPIRSSKRLKSFFFNSALLWNSLPSSIQSIERSTAFKSALEKFWVKKKYDVSDDIVV